MPRATEAGKRQAGGRKPEALGPAGSLLVHDIKNLSFRLGSLLQNLDANYEDPLFKKSVVEILADTVRKMNGIVRRCRDRRGEVIVKVPVDLNALLSGLVEAVPRSFQEKTRIFIEERYVRIPRIWADAEFLGEAFSIVIQNALESMEGTGGRLTLATTARTTKAGKRQVVVTIADTGCGMPPQFVQDQLFAPFVTTKEQGLGLGLYACRKIIALHDGAIRVRSREGRGSTFRLVFGAL